MPILTEKRKSRIRYYSKAFAQHLLIPDAWYRKQLDKKLAQFDQFDEEVVLDRVNYYNKLDGGFSVTDGAVCLSDLSNSRQSMSYYDYRETLRYFPTTVRADLIFNDYNSVPDEPRFLKSRLISANNENGVLLKLRKVRHYQPIVDSVRFEQKKNLLVWRGAGWQLHRLDFLKLCWNHPLCDVGQVNPPSEVAPKEWVKPKMSIDEQLQYKYILSLQGTDIATNIKWIAQSNSLCFMTKPKVEDWFMDGRLLAGIHYVELKGDYSDITEKIEYYNQHTDEALEIISNFQNYYRQFLNRELEELISLMVVAKYLRLSGQFD